MRYLLPSTDPDIILNPAHISEIIPPVLLVRSDSHQIFQALKSPSKINGIINLSGQLRLLVLTGNKYGEE
jgi:hypothetical protein